MKKNIIVIFLISIFTLSIYADPYTYIQEKGKKKEFYRYEIESLPNGNSVIYLSSYMNDFIRKSKFIVDKNFATLSWDYINPEFEIELFAYRDKNYIYINGYKKGKKILKALKVDSHPWHQLFPFSLSAFIKQNNNINYFWAVHPTDFRHGKFQSKKIKSEKIKLNEIEQEAVKMKLSLTGFLSAFWHAYCWYNPNSGVYLKYNGRVGGIGTPTIEVKLMNLNMAFKNLNALPFREGN
jgi:hypothetical protein